MPGQLSGTRRNIFDAIVDYIKDHGIAPSVRDLASDFGMSVNGMQGHLQKLDELGWIGRHPNVSRGIYIRLGATCPCCGQKVKQEQSNGKA